MILNENDKESIDTLTGYVAHNNIRDFNETISYVDFYKSLSDINWTASLELSDDHKILYLSSINHSSYFIFNKSYKEFSEFEILAKHQFHDLKN